MHSGSILQNVTTGSTLGAVVFKFPNKIILFRTVNGMEPSFTKLPLQGLDPAIQVAGNINEIHHEPIKTALLRYYRRANLPQSEKAILDHIMEYAFPNGVPLVDTQAGPGEHAQAALALHDRIKLGSSLYINSVPGSCFHHLDNQRVYVMGQEPGGIWVSNHTSGTEPVMTFLPYKDRKTPTFWSITRILPIEKKVPGDISHDKSVIEGYKKKFDEAKRLGTLFSQIQHGDDRLRIDPSNNNQVIIPVRLKNKIYDYRSGNLRDIESIDSHSSVSSQVGSEQIDNTVDLNEPLVKNKKKKAESGSHTGNNADYAPKIDNLETELDDTVLKLWDVDYERTGNTMDNILPTMTGGSKRSARLTGDEFVDIYDGSSQPSSANSLPATNASSDYPIDEDLARLMAEDGMSSSAARDSNGQYPDENGELSDGGSSANSDSFSERNLEFIDEDEPVTVLETVQKIRQMPVPELEKVFKDTILKGHLLKQKFEKLPAYLRDNTFFGDRIHKEVNIISLIKNKATLENHSVRLVPDTFQPLVEQYMKRDFSAGFLIPLVISTKKIYLTKRDMAAEDDYHKESSHVISDFYKHMHDLEKEAATGGRKRTINLDDELGRTLNEQMPHIAHQSNLGFLVRLGEKISPEDHLATDGTIKLKTDRAAERIQHLNQQTTVIRYGNGRSFNIQNYSVTPRDFDSHVVLGPLADYPPNDKTTYTIEEIEAMEDEIDRNISAVSSRYNMYYLGDNMSLIGFVRPPISEYCFAESVPESMDSLATRLDTGSVDGNVVIKYLDDMPDENPLDENGQPTSIGPALDDPTKFIVYLIPGIESADGKTKRNQEPPLNQNALRTYLQRAIPKMQDIVSLFKQEYDIANASDMSRLIDVLYKFDYIVPGTKERPTETGDTRQKTQVSYENWQHIRSAEDAIIRSMVEYSERLDKMTKLRRIRKRKLGEKTALTQASGGQPHGDKSGSKLVINDSLIEMADKVYGETFHSIAGTGPITESDEYRIDYYSHQIDKSRYIELLLRKSNLEKLQQTLNPEMLENTLFVLKEKYEGLAKSRPDLEALIPREIADKVKVCGSRTKDRKPKIVKYPSVERLKEDNGKVAMTPSGEVILEGDFAFATEGDARLLFKREALAEGDYWIGQPISVLESLLFKKRDSCENPESANEAVLADLAAKRAAMKLPGETADMSAEEDEISHAELAKCIFDVNTITCLPPEVASMDSELREIEARIRDVKGQLEFSKTLGPMLADCEKAIASVEKVIRNYNSGIDALNKYSEAMVQQRQRELEAMIRRKKDCTHYNVMDYLDSLHNLTNIERYMLVNQVIDRFENQEHTMSLDLLEIKPDRAENHIECHVCNQYLMCKHYKFALELMSNSPTGELDDEALREVYGEEISGSYYCRVCGVFLSNTPVQDIEEFEKDAAKEGMHVQTRSVLHELDLVERQRQAVDAVIASALQDPNDDDLRFKLRIYRLCKDLCGLEMLSVEDELEMVNFIKSYEFVSRKSFFNLFFLKFLKAKGGVAAGINKTVVDKLSDEQYWKHVTCDIAARFLVTIQTSIHTYAVFNKLCSNNYVGWPLIGGVNPDDAKEDMGGVDLMLCIMKQMSIVPEFKYLAGGDTGFEGVRSLLVRRIEELIRNNELVRTRLDRALETKYTQITLMEEFGLHHTNFWDGYKPSLTTGINVKWTPKHEIDQAAAAEWTPKILPNMIHIAKDNIVYQAQVLRARLTEIMEAEPPANRPVLAISTANSCIPLDYERITGESAATAATTGKVDNETDSAHARRKTLAKYINPEVNYYTQVEKMNEGVRNILRKIGEYQKLVESLEQVNVAPTVKFIYPMEPFVAKREPFNLQLTSDELRAYFLKYIDSGPNKGETHLYDPYGRCLVSNVLKSDVELITYGQADFEKLFRAVSRRNIVHDMDAVKSMDPTVAVQDQPLLVALVNAMCQLRDVQSGSELAETKSVLAQLGVHAGTQQTKLLDLAANNLGFNRNIEKVTSDYNSLRSLVNTVKRLEQAMNKTVGGGRGAKRVSRLSDYVVKSTRIAHGRLSEVLVASLGVGFTEFYAGPRAKDGAKFDAKREYFALLSMIDNEKQMEIADVVENIGGNRKEEAGLETTLINLAQLKDIAEDYKTFLVAQEKIIPHIDYVNLEHEVETQHHITRGNLIRKMILDTRVIVNNVKNGTWSGLKSVDDMYYNVRQFYKYKDAASQFGKLSPIVNAVYEISNQIRSVNDGALFTSELNESLLHYLFVLMCCCLVEVVSDKASQTTRVITHEFVPEETDSQSTTTQPTVQEVNQENEFVFSRPTSDLRKAPVLATDEKAATAPEEDSVDIDRELYPELLDGESELRDEIDENEPYVDEPLSTNRMVEVKTTQRNLILDFVRDVVKYVADLEGIYNEMNLKRITEQIAKTNEQQTKLNLRVPKFLAQEGMEDDYRMVRNLISLGFLEYSELNQYMLDNFGEDIFRGEEDAVPDLYAEDGEGEDGGRDESGLDPDMARAEQARYNKYGLDNEELDEMGYVGEPDECDEQDYGYLAVDES